MNLYGHQILIAQADGPSWIEVPVPRKLGTTLQPGITGSLDGLVIQKQLQFIHSLKAPASGPFRAVEFKSVFTVRPTDDSTDLQRPSRPVGKSHHRTHVILIRDRRNRPILADRKMRPRLAGNRTFGNERFVLRHHFRHWPRQHQRHVQGMRHQVTQHTEPSLVPFKTPRQHALGVVPVSTKESSSVMRHLPQTALLDQCQQVLHDRAPSVAKPGKRQQTSRLGSGRDFPSL